MSASGNGFTKPGYTNADLTDPFKQNLIADPQQEVTTLLGSMGQLNYQNPFTNFLVRNLGSQGALDNLLAFYSPANSDHGTLGKFDFNNSLISSFFPGATQKLPTGVTTNPVDSSMIPNLADYQGVGTKISSLLSGKDQSTVGQLIASGKATASDIHDYLTNLIDLNAPYSMDSIQKQLIENQLDDMETQYWLSGAYQDGTDFGKYLLNKASDWLNKWWQTGDASQADSTVRTGGTSAEDKAKADQIKASIEQAQSAQDKQAQVPGASTQFYSNGSLSY